MAPTSRWDAIAQAGQGSRCQALVGHPEHHGGICKQNQPPERNGLGKKELRWGTRWEMAPAAPLIPPSRAPPRVSAGIRELPAVLDALLDGLLA